MSRAFVFVGALEIFSSTFFYLLGSQMVKQSLARIPNLLFFVHSALVTQSLPQAIPFVPQKLAKEQASF